MAIANKNGWTMLIIMLCGIVLGGFIGQLTEGIGFLSWLNYGQSFGLTNPVTLDLGILALTFGLTIRISIASILGMVLGIVIYKLL